MEFYTLDEKFLRRDVIDSFNTAIWTERYTKFGDFTLTLPASKENIAKLVEGTFLALKGSKEVMIIETNNVEKGLLKCTGPSLLKFLDQRLIRYSANHADRYYNITMSPGLAMGFIVNDMCVTGPYVSSSAYGIDGPREVIQGLQVIGMDDSVASVALAVPYGPLYSALEQLAETYQIGQRLTLVSASSAVYYLGYETYKGKDRTSTQTVNDVVRFSPNVDSLTNIKELFSIAGYKNVAYAFAPGNPVPGVTQSGVAYADGEAAASVGFKRRVLMVFADDITTDKVGGSAAVLLQVLNQRAADALANNNYVKVVDGEVVPQTQYKFGRDYGLGDIVELQSARGLLQKARITEYIRSQDQNGERSYPTISVID